MSKIILIDFDDSFIFNIFSDLKRLKLNGEIVHWQKLSNLKFNPKEQHVIIYGPGPGHPDEYKRIYPQIKKWLKEKNIFHMGICLGHQLLWNVNGCPIEKSIKPLHGQTVTLKIPEWNRLFPKSHWGKLISVQRYNSLSINTQQSSGQFILDEEWHEPIMGRGKNFITYQFHPESVGTSCRKLFFNPIVAFLDTIRVDE